ncbi:MAG: hypothetical protein Q8P18_11980 [Pseudomonadota bacterium]|nr:hypothetical protein [Pseudomonadota bacterium]
MASPESRPWLPLVLLLLGSLAIGAAAVWPVPTAVRALVPDTTFTDGHRIALGFADGTLPFFTRTGARTLDIAGGADFRPLLWPADLLAAVAGPLLALNLVFILIPAFNAVCGWILGAALRLGAWSRFVLGAAIAFNPWVHTTLANGQLEQAVLGGAALVWAVALLGAARPWIGAPLLAVTTFAVGTAAPHVALAACAALPIWAVVSLVAEGRQDRRSAVFVGIRWLLLIGAAAIGAQAASRYHAPNFDAVVRLFAPFGSVDAAPVGAQVKRAVLLSDLFVAPGLPPRLANGVVHSGYLGVPLLVAALAGVGWRRAPLLAGLACLVLAFGAGTTFPLPYAGLEALSPTIAASGTPYRFLIGAIVGLAASAAAIPWGPRGALALVALLWASGWTGDPRPLPLASVAVAHDPSTVALSVGTGPVLDLPVPGPRCKEGATHYLLEATEHGRPVPVVLRPSSEAWPKGDRAFARRVDAGLNPCDPDVLAEIRAAGFTAVVAHGHRNCNLAPEEAACLRTAFGPGTSQGKVTWWSIE